MEYEIFHRDLLIQLRNRIPKNSKLVTKLAEILSLEREAVYRRLRQDVSFTIEEIAIITKEFNVSLDSILGANARTTQLFRFQSLKDENPIKIDYLLLEECLQVIKEVASDSKGKISLVTNLLPRLLYTGFIRIFRFYFFKWRYYSTPVDQTLPYHEIVLSDRIIQMVEDIFAYSKNIKNCYYILDNRIFHNFVNDVNYFNSIRLIRDEDVLLIKNELFRFLDYMEEIAAKGFADNPSNKVFIYISDTCIDSSYSFVNSKFSSRFALIWSFIFNSVLIFEEETLKMMEYRIRSKIRTSTLLSVTGEKQRTLYFEAQRKIVEQLCCSYTE